MKRRKFIKDLSLTTTGVLSFPGIMKSEEKIINLGYIPITDAAPLLMAYDLGFFKEEGLIVNKPRLVRSWSILAESFISGKFNLTHMLFPMPLWLRYSLKKSAKIMAWDHCNGSAITVSASSGISRFEDFSQKTIAVPYWYSMHNMLLQMGLKKAELKPQLYKNADLLDKGEAKLIVMPPSEMPSALSAGKIDAFIVAEPFNALAELKIQAKIFRFTGDIWQNHPCCVVVMDDSMITENPITTRKIINAVTRAQLWLTNEPDKSAKRLSSEGGGYLPVSYETLKRVFTFYDPLEYQTPQAIKNPQWPVSRINFQPYPFPSATRLICETMKSTEIEGSIDFLKSLKTDFILKDLVNEHFVKESIKEIGGIHMFNSRFPDKFKRKEILSL